MNLLEILNGLNMGRQAINDQDHAEEARQLEQLKFRKENQISQAPAQKSIMQRIADTINPQGSSADAATPAPSAEEQAASVPGAPVLGDASSASAAPGVKPYDATPVPGMAPVLAPAGAAPNAAAPGVGPMALALSTVPVGKKGIASADQSAAGQTVSVGDFSAPTLDADRAKLAQAQAAVLSRQSSTLAAAFRALHSDNPDEVAAAQGVLAAQGQAGKVDTQLDDKLQNKSDIADGRNQTRKEVADIAGQYGLEKDAQTGQWHVKVAEIRGPSRGSLFLGGGGGAGSPAAVHAFAALNQLTKQSTSEYARLSKLASQPAYALIGQLDENGQPITDATAAAKLVDLQKRANIAKQDAENYGGMARAAAELIPGVSGLPHPGAAKVTTTGGSSGASHSAAAKLVVPGSAGHQPLTPQLQQRAATDQKYRAALLANGYVLQ